MARRGRQQLDWRLRVALLVLALTSPWWLTPASYAFAALLNLSMQPGVKAMRNLPNAIPVKTK